MIPRNEIFFIETRDQLKISKPISALLDTQWPPATMILHLMRIESGKNSTMEVAGITSEVNVYTNGGNKR